MKRKFLSILLTLAMALTLLPTAAMADETPSEGGGSAPVEAPVETKVAQIGDVKYDTLAEAVEAVPTNNAETEIVLLNDYIGSGIKVVAGKNIVFNLNGKTYTVNKPTVGSSGTETNGFQLLKGSKVTFKNGALSSKTGADSLPNGGILIQNYCDLTLENVTLDTSANSNISYVISNNFGSLTATGNTVIKAADGKVAFDLWYGMNSNGLYDDGVSVTFGTDFTGSVTGKIEYGAHSRVPSDSNWKDKARLAIANGNFDTTFVDSNNNDGVAPEDFNISISGGTFNTDVSAYVADGYILNNGTVEKLGETNAVAKVGDTYYKTLTDAVKAADNATVTLLKDVTEDVTIPAGKTITLDLNGKTLTNVKDHTILNNGNLTIAGTGKVDNISHAKGALYNKGTVVVNGGTFDRSKENGKNKGESGQNSWYTIKNVGTMTINDGAIVQTAGNNASLGKFSSLVSNGYFNAGDYTNNKGLDQPILTIDGGTFRGGLNTIKNDDRAKLTINGGTFSNYYQAVVQNHNIAEITGGTFTAASDANAETYGIYNCGCGAEIDLGTLTVSGGTFTGATYAVAEVSSQNAAVNISGGQFAGTKAAIVKSSTSNATIAISGGLFSSDPSDYVAAGHYVDASNNGDYPYIVKEGTKPAGALIVVKDKTDTAVSGDITGTDKTAINDVIGNANVDGVAEAAKKADIVTKSGVTVAENDKVEIEVAVKVEAKAADLAKGQLTFEASPVATVKVNGAATGTTVPVTNAMLNGKPITVKLPLPTVDGKLFTPKQILHKFTGGGYEYFINETVGSKRGAGSFKIEGDCAVFTIYGFSTFELSGTVTYVEPSSGGGSSSSSRRYDVSAPSVKHGDVTVSPKNASKGDTVTITVKPDSGYQLDDLTVTDKNGKELKLTDKGNGKYIFTMPASKVEINATFVKEVETSPFSDVSTSAYYYEAVKWAQEKGITGGIGNGLFGPNQPCTRAQIVTFLWRAAGSPEPKAMSSFADVSTDAYYAKAVAWAVENGITTGTGDGKFSPDATCTRAQSVTFLFRAIGKLVDSKAEFSDVLTDSYYANAVAWAVENGVTNGIGDGLFGPDNSCTRAQIVTFLFRAYQGK